MPLGCGDDPRAITKDGLYSHPLSTIGKNEEKSSGGREERPAQLTLAAAATAVVMKLTAMPAEPVAVTVDRPFLFLIRDVASGSVLFLGHVVNSA